MKIKKSLYFVDVGRGSEIAAVHIEMTTCYTSKRAVTTVYLDPF